MSDSDEIGRQVAQNLSGAITRALGSEDYESARSSSPEPEVQDQTIQHTEGTAVAAPSPRSSRLATLAAGRELRPTSPRPNMEAAAQAAAKRANDAAAEAEAVLKKLHDAAVKAANNHRDRIKVPKLDSTEASDWRAFRFSLERAVAANGYDDARGIEEVIACMVGPAKKAIMHLPTAGTLVAYLDSIEHLFVSPSASVLARSEFYRARQEVSESVADFHGRLREIYCNAYPEDRDRLNTRPGLIHRFAHHLRDPMLARLTAQAMPATFDEALRRAQDSMAILQEQRIINPAFYAKTEPTPPKSVSAILSPPSSSAFGKKNPWNPSSSSASSSSGDVPECRFCGMRGHTIDVCRNLIFDSNKRKRNKGNRFFGNKNKRFNRGGKNGDKRRKQGGDNDRRVAAVQEEDIYNTGN